MEINNKPTPVLKSFAKKLANCHQDVPLYRLLDYFDNGMYGYSCEEGFDEVVTNDYVFADDVATCITHIKKIIKEPHIFLKREAVVQNVSVASKIDNESLMENYKDPKYWTVKDNKDPEPEYVHAYVNEDNLAIYENRFISALIDLLIDKVSKKINYIKKQFLTVNKLVGDDEDQLGYSHEHYVNLMEENEELPVVVSIKKPITKVFYLLTKDKKELQNLRHSEFYVACKKAGRFNIDEVRMTNILVHDFEYNYCYTFFMKYIRKDDMITTEAQAYYDFVLINLVKAITQLGFTYEQEEASIFITSKASAKITNLEFTSKLLRIKLEQAAEHDILMTVTCVADGNSGSYLIKTLHSSEAKEGFDIDKYCEELDKPDEDKKYIFANLISDIKTTKANYAYVNPKKVSVLKRLRTFLKSFMVVVEGSAFIHARVCPVCGADFVSPDETDNYCVLCESLYHIFGFGGREYVWLKHLPRVTKRSELEDEEEDDVVLEEDVVGQFLSEAEDVADEQVEGEEDTEEQSEYDYAAAAMSRIRRRQLLMRLSRKKNALSTATVAPLAEGKTRRRINMHLYQILKRK